MDFDPASEEVAGEAGSPWRSISRMMSSRILVAVSLQTVGPWRDPGVGWVGNRRFCRAGARIWCAIRAAQPVEAI